MKKSSYAIVFFHDHFNRYWYFTWIYFKFLARNTRMLTTWYLNTHLCDSLQILTSNWQVTVTLYPSERFIKALQSYDLCIIFFRPISICLHHPKGQINIALSKGSGSQWGSETKSRQMFHTSQHFLGRDFLTDLQWEQCKSIFLPIGCWRNIIVS